MQLWDCLHCYGGGIVVGGQRGIIIYYIIFVCTEPPSGRLNVIWSSHTHTGAALWGGGVSSTVTFTPSSLTYAGIHMWLCCHLLSRPSSLCLQIKVQPSPPWITERHEVNIWYWHREKWSCWIFQRALMKNTSDASPHGKRPSEWEFISVCRDEPFQDVPFHCREPGDSEFLKLHLLQTHLYFCSHLLWQCGGVKKRKLRLPLLYTLKKLQ